MREVVIIGTGTLRDHSLFGLLNDLFPECEVRVVSVWSEPSDEALTGFRKEKVSVRYAASTSQGLGNLW